MSSLSGRVLRSAANHVRLLAPTATARLPASQGKLLATSCSHQQPAGASVVAQPHFELGPEYSGGLGSTSFEHSDGGAGKPISLVIFDKDGTLICFHSMWVPWAKEVARRLSAATGLILESDVFHLLGYCPVVQRVRSGLLAEGTMAQIRLKLAHLVSTKVAGLGDVETRRIVDESVPDCCPLKTLREIHNTRLLFKQLQCWGIKVAICTADSRRGTTAALNALGLDSHVDMLICGDDEGSLPKPHPYNALRICRALGVSTEEAMMVGDTLADVKMGRSARLGASVGVLSGVATRDELQHSSDHVLDDVGQLTRLITSISEGVGFECDPELNNTLF